jgi:hypothetical protein
MRRAHMSARLLILFGVSAAFGAGPPPALADDACAAFTWDVHHERTLFGQPPRSLAAGQTPAASPALATDQLYQLKLSAQPKVTFVAPPGRQGHSAGTYAGLARVTIDTPGVYRISLDQAVWVDVVSNGAIVEARDHQGRRGCNAPHKIVEFSLPAGTPMTLQFSGDAPTVKVTVTRSPS